MVSCHLHYLRLGNYDVSEMHYNGPTGTQGYGYGIRTEGRSSANPPA